MRAPALFCTRALLLIVTIAPFAQADFPVDTFTSDAQKWAAYSFGYIPSTQLPDFASALGGSSAVSWTPDFGNPAGSIQKVDPDSGVEYFVAGPDFLGNLSNAFLENLRFDESEVGNTNLTLDVFDPIAAIQSGSTTLVFGTNPAVPSSSGWSSYSLPLASAAWCITSTQNCVAPTDAQFQQVLANVTGLFVLADWYIGTDTTALDNVTITPEPSTLLLGLSAICLTVLLSKNYKESRLAR